MEYFSGIAHQESQIMPRTWRLDSDEENFIFGVSPKNAFSHSQGQKRRFRLVRRTSALPPKAASKRTF
jgi:hypothetical protein